MDNTKCNSKSRAEQDCPDPYSVRFFMKIPVNGYVKLCYCEILSVLYYLRGVYMGNPG